MKRRGAWAMLPHMMYYDEYEASDAAVDALLESAALGRLVTLGSDGTPHIGLYPFYVREGAIHLHLNRHDEQLADLSHRSRCLFEVDEVLATIPSYWIDPQNARMATAYHRCAAFTCTAEVSEDTGVIALGQSRIMQRYQPEGNYRELSADDDLYTAGLELLAAISLRVETHRSKFKLAQNRPAEARRDIAKKLRARGHLMDERAAAALESTILDA